MKKYLVWFIGSLGFLFAISFGLWAQMLFTQSESVHFSVNFPSGPGTAGANVMSCCDLGGPWASISEQGWNGYPAGGILVWGTEGEIVVDVGKEGFLKRVLQPDLINLSTHWLRNVGTQPYQIQLEMDLCGIDLEWETHEVDWDPVTKTSTRMIEPGKAFNMDWYFRIPHEYMDRRTICEGHLNVFDARTESLLTTLPINIVNSRARQ